MKIQSELPSPVDFFTSAGLYIPYDCSGEKVWSAVNLIYYRSTIDTYCVECGKDSTFRGRPGAIPQHLDRKRWVEAQALVSIAPIGSPKPVVHIPTIPSSVYKIDFSCARDDHYLLFFVVAGCDTDYGKSVNWIKKVGQNPSLADLAQSSISKYRGLLRKDRSIEFVRAIELHAHGYEIASFVHLRRIFESLIEEARLAESKRPGWDEVAYQKQRMGERIQTLRNLLPPFLVAHPHLYGILSEGLHSLTEEECAVAYPRVKLAIELILDQKIEQQERERKEREASQGLGKQASGSERNRA